MADLIDRDALGVSLFPLGKKDAADIYRLIMDAPAVNRWISVEDALPENNEIVWICFYWGKDAYVRKGLIKNEVWYTADGYRMLIIPKFWMHEYIPKPPEKE